MYPLISILIPAFKTKFLKEAIDSVYSQTYKHWELIILDDASPENINSIICNYDDKRIKYYRNSHNVGAENVVDNWNKCLNLCCGEYVICMGDDDMLLPDALEEYVKIIHEYPGLNVYHAMTDVIDENGKIISHQRQRSKFQTAEELILNRWSGDIQFIGDFCYRADHLKQNGGYYKLPLAWASDDITAVRAAEDTGIANTQHPCFLYRSNNMSISSSSNNGVKLDAKALERQWYFQYFKRHPNVGSEIYPSAFEEWFYTQISHHLNLFFQESIFNLFQALRKSKALGYRKSMILRVWYLVFKQKVRFFL